MKKLAILLVVGSMLAACSAQPIYNSAARPIPIAAQQFPTERIESLIIEAGMSRYWQFTREGPGHLSAVQSRSSSSATVDVYFDQQTYRVAYRSSTGLLEEDGKINHYNLWARNLESDIQDRLTSAASASTAQAN
jgi:hypothetical protein